MSLIAFQFSVVITSFKLTIDGWIISYKLQIDGLIEKNWKLKWGNWSLKNDVPFQQDNHLVLLADSNVTKTWKWAVGVRISPVLKLFFSYIRQ